MKLRWLEYGDGHEDSPIVQELQYQEHEGDEWMSVPTVNKYDLWEAAEK